jgi:hypothetical protein
MRDKQSKCSQVPSCAANPLAWGMGCSGKGHPALLLLLLLLAGGYGSVFNM